MSVRALALRAIGAGSAAVLALTLAGCGGSPKPAGPSVSLLPPEPSESQTPEPPASPTAEASTFLPAACNQLLPPGTVDTALGGHLAGETTFLKAAPLPASGRTGRVTCGYGVTVAADGTKSPPLVEASYITYTDAATAAHRVDLTIAKDKAAGATATEVEVNGKPATVLTSQAASVLVMADGTRTLVLSVDATLVAAGSTTPMVTMATAMLTVGPPPVAPTPST